MALTIISIVERGILSANAYLSNFTNSVISGFLLALPYTGLASLVLSGRIA
jgi:hypothetical protein